MAEIKAPVFPESVADGTIVEWHVTEGQEVSRDDLLAEIETDKVVLEVVAPDNGVVTKIVKQVDDTVLSDELIAEFEAGASGSTDSGSADKGDAPAVDPDKMAQMQQAQQDAEIQQQQSAAQHATAMSQAQVQVAQNTAMADPGFIKKSMEKETAKPSAKATSKTSKKVVPRKKGVA